MEKDGEPEFDKLHSYANDDEVFRLGIAVAEVDRRD